MIFDTRSVNSSCYEASFYLADTVVSPLYFTAETELLQVHTDLFRLRCRGVYQTWLFLRFDFDRRPPASVQSVWQGRL